MFDALTWMFKVKDFNKHFLYLCLISVGFVIAAIIFAVLTFIFAGNLDFLTATLLRVVNILIIFIPMLCITGYFWSLTDNIINRDDDLIANNIYNGKLKVINKIELPEFKFFKFVWRGIASIVATILLYLPFSLFFGYIIINLANVSDFWQWNQQQATIFYTIIIVMISVFIPGLLWNYARRDSIVAVWNLPKAMYIMGNYTGKYIKNTCLFVLMSFLHSFIVQLFMNLIGLNIQKTVASNGADMISITSAGGIILPLIAVSVVTMAIGIYWLFVNAYLLGTIAPPSEY